MGKTKDLAKYTKIKLPQTATTNIVVICNY